MINENNNKYPWLFVFKSQQNYKINFVFSSKTKILYFVPDYYEKYGKLSHLIHQSIN